MNDSDEFDPRERWARLRFAIVGPLLAAPPEAGQLQRILTELAAKTWRHPLSGAPVQFGRSTIERWFYLALHAPHDPVGALRPRRRADAGTHRQLSVALRAVVQGQYQAHPSWSYQLHHDNLAVQIAQEPTLGPLPSYATLRRYLKSQGMSKRRRRPQPRAGAEPSPEAARPALEVRSFEAEYVQGLWHVDFHHGSRAVLSADGHWVKPLLLGILDDHSRLACHVQWYLDESAETLVHGRCQAFQKRALPRALMTDNGGAMLAEEVREGLLRLGIVHETTLPYSPYQNAKQEVFWASVEGRLMAMLEGVEALSLELLNQATHAWVEREYHRKRHSELGCTPLERYLQGPAVGRDSPSSEALRRTFRLEVGRRQRQSDGTVSVAGRRFEIPSRYRHLERVRVRYARWDLRSVELIDPHTQAPLATLYPLDKTANAEGHRRALEPCSEVPTPAPPPGGDIAPLLKQLMAEYAATGLPPAYVPKPPQG